MTMKRNVPQRTRGKARLPEDSCAETIAFDRVQVGQEVYTRWGTRPWIVTSTLFGDPVQITQQRAGRVCTREAPLSGLWPE